MEIVSSQKADMHQIAARFTLQLWMQMSQKHTLFDRPTSSCLMGFIVTVDTDHKLGMNLFSLIFFNSDWFNKKYVFDLTSNVISPNYTFDNILHPNLFVSIM